MFGFIKNALGTLASPLTGALDLAGDALGLPKVVTNSIKAAVGVATGNVLMVADGVSGVMSELAKNQSAQTEYAHARCGSTYNGEGYAQGPAHGATQGSHGASAPAQTGGGILDPITLEYRDSLRQLAANFDLLEGVEGLIKNGKVNTDTLRKAVGNANLPEGLRKACKFFLKNPEYRNMLDTAGKGGFTDGIISTKDVQAALTKVNSDIAQYGIRGSPPASQPSSPAPAAPAPTTGSTSSSPAQGTGGTSSNNGVGSGWGTSGSGSTGGRSVRDIIADRGMTMEQKIQEILMAIEEKLDNEILGAMGDLAAAQEKRDGIENNEKNKKELSDADRNLKFIEMRLQTLMEKRRSMNDLMSNMSSKFNEMAKTAINNLRSA